MEKKPKEPLSQDEILAKEHDEYMKIVNDSGMPRWLWDMHSHWIEPKIEDYDNKDTTES